MIEIRNGCTVFGFDEDTQLITWEYIDAKSAGIIRTYFTSPALQSPKIGDFISDDFRLVPRTEPKIIPSERDRFREDKDYTYRR